MSAPTSFSSAATSPATSNRPALLARELLAEARARVSIGWCQGTAARDANGRSVLPSDPAANSWSAAGAVMAAAHLHAAEEDDNTDPQAFALAMSALSSVVNAGPQSWNDRPEQTTDEVITALTEAIDLLTGRRRP